MSWTLLLLWLFCCCCWAGEKTTVNWLNLSPALIAFWLQVVLLATGASVFIGTECGWFFLPSCPILAAGMLLAQAGYRLPPGC